MLYYPVGESKPKRIQGAFVSDKEIEGVVNFIKSQNTEIDYNEEILNDVEVKGIGTEVDEYMKEAIELVVASEQASVSMIQRKFKVGYNRAARMIDEMEERNIVGPSKGSKARDVLISMDELKEMENGG